MKIPELFATFGYHQQSVDLGENKALKSTRLNKLDIGLMIGLVKPNPRQENRKRALRIGPASLRSWRKKKSKMKQVSYLGYVITATAKNESSWRSHAIITWYAGKFEIYDDVTFTTEREAEEHAIELGKNWVNNRLQSLQG